MVKIKDLVIEKEMSSRKYKNIRNIKKYKYNIANGIFKQMELQVSRLEKRNLIIKWWYDYKYKYYYTTYKTPNDIEVKLKMCFAEAFSRELTKQLIRSL